MLGCFANDCGAAFLPYIPDSGAVVASFVISVTVRSSGVRSGATRPHVGPQLRAAARQRSDVAGSGRCWLSAASSSSSSNIVTRHRGTVDAVGARNAFARGALASAALVAVCLDGATFDFALSLLTALDVAQLSQETASGATKPVALDSVCVVASLVRLERDSRFAHSHSLSLSLSFNLNIARSGTSCTKTSRR